MANIIPQSFTPGVGQQYTLNRKMGEPRAGLYHSEK